MQAPSGGQARVEGATGNAPMGNITFGLEGATFTGVVLNPVGSGNGTFIVTELNGDTTSFPFVLGNGNNFVTITAINGQQIKSVMLSTPAPGIEDLRQVRMAGLERTNSVPDSGATVLLLGAALTGMGLLRRRFEASV